MHAQDDIFLMKYQDVICILVILFLHALQMNPGLLILFWGSSLEM
jgi:hypothetical protein